MERVPIKSEPQLFDNVIAEIQQGLANNLMWLNFSFGKAERLVKQINGRKYYTPNVYLGKNEYVLIAPDSGLGNFSFFVLDEPQDVEWAIGDRTHLSTPFSLIVWFDIRTIEQTDERNTEYVKQKILQLLNGGLFLRNGRITINRIYEKAENIFKGFSLDEIDNQFLMQPFAGFRFEGEMSAATDCIEVIPPTPPIEPKYIRGHVFDTVSTFTFIVNGNEQITVNVAPDGWWRWNADRDVISLAQAFINKAELDRIEIVNLVDCESMRQCFQGCIYLSEIVLNRLPAVTDAYGLTTGCSTPKDIILKNINFDKIDSAWRLFVYSKTIKGVESSTFENVTSIYQMFLNYSGENLYLDNATFDNVSVTTQAFINATRLKELRIKRNKASLSLSTSSLISKESILSLINAAAANITYTLNATPYAKCATGGEWHTEIQSAIDAKAAQGFTVTLISA